MAFCIFMFLQVAWAGPKMATYPPQKISLKGIRRIEIRGVNGHLHLIGRSRHFATLKVRHSDGRAARDWYLSVARRGHTLRLEVFNTIMGSEWWHQIRRDRVPEFDLDLEGPPVPVVASWREGQLDFQNWGAALDVSFLRGQAHVTGGRGPLSLQVVHGDLSVKDRVGAVKIRGDTGDLNLDEIRGPVRLTWMDGHYSIENIKGSVHLQARSGTLFMSNGEGQTEIHLTDGKATLNQVRGRLKLVGRSAHWDIRGEGADDVRVTSNTGPVQVHWSKGGVKAFLASSLGAIRIPKKWWRVGPRRPHAVEGKSAQNALGQLFVETHSGAIQLSTGIP